MADSKAAESPKKVNTSPRPVRLKRHRCSDEGQESLPKSADSADPTSSETSVKVEPKKDGIEHSKPQDSSNSTNTASLDKGDRVMDSLLRGFVANKLAMIEEERKQRLKLLKEQTIKEEDGLYDGLVEEIDGDNSSPARSRHKKDKKNKKDKKAKKKKDKEKDRDRDKRHKHKHRSRSQSKERKNRSRSRSRGRKSRSSSRSKDKRHRSRSKSKDRKRHSRSRSKEKSRHRSRSRDRISSKYQDKSESYHKEDSHDRKKSPDIVRKSKDRMNDKEPQRSRSHSRSRSPHLRSTQQRKTQHRSSSPHHARSPLDSPTHKSPQHSKSPQNKSATRSPDSEDRSSKFRPRHALSKNSDDELDFVSKLATTSSKTDTVDSGKSVLKSKQDVKNSLSIVGVTQKCDMNSKVNEQVQEQLPSKTSSEHQKPVAAPEVRKEEVDKSGSTKTQAESKSEPIRPVVEHTKTETTFTVVKETKKSEDVKEEPTDVKLSEKPLPKPAAILKEYIEKSASGTSPSPLRMPEPKPAKMAKISIGKIGEAKLGEGTTVKEESVDVKPAMSATSGTSENDAAAAKKAPITIGVKITETSAAFIQSGMRVDQKTGKTYEDGEISDSGDAGGDSGDEDGEVSEDDDGSGKKKKKHKHKHRKKRHKNSKDGDSKKRRTAAHRSRSRSPKKRKHSKSRSKSRSPDRRGRRSKSRSREKDRRRKRSRSRDRRDDGFWGRERPYRRSRSPERKSAHSSKEVDLRLKIDKAKLRKIAIANAFANMQSGQGPPVELKPDLLASMKAGGHSIEDLTKFCQKIARKEGDPELSDSLSDSMSGSEGEDAPFINHPFKLRDIQPNIVMNIRNAKQIPIMTPADKAAASSTLRLQFPVSSGTQHRTKESEWVPVPKTSAPPVKPAPTAPRAVSAYGSPLEPTTATATATTTSTTSPISSIASTSSTPAAPAAAVAAAAVAAAAVAVSKVGGGSTTAPAFPPMPTPSTTPLMSRPVPEAERVFPTEQSQGPPINIGELVSARLTAMRQLQANPYNVEAISKMHHAQKQMTAWAQSKELPGQFTGSTGAQILTPQQLAGPDPRFQAWAKKVQALLPPSGELKQL